MELVNVTPGEKMKIVAQLIGLLMDAKVSTVASRAYPSHEPYFWPIPNPFIPCNPLRFSCHTIHPLAAIPLIHHWPIPKKDQ